MTLSTNILSTPPGYGEIIRTDLKLTDSGERATSLTDFRDIYRAYRQDPALQRAMENHTWIIILDDHEIADNCYWDYANNTMDVNVDDPPHPIYDQLRKDTKAARDKMRQLFEEATQAWTEYVPARVEKVSDSIRPHYKLYRHFRFGSLVDFFLTDSRTYRDKPNLEINNQILEKAKVSQSIAAARQELGLKDWQASMLGKEQKEWLLNGITRSDAATWKVWGNQTLLATSLANEMIGEIDDWHGFKAERYEILQTVKDSETLKHGTDRTSYFVVFTGDMHTSLIAYLKTDFSGDVGDIDVSPSGVLGGALKGAKNIAGGLLTPIDSLKTVVESVETAAEAVKNKVNWDYSKLAGVEFMTPSVTSPGISEGLISKLEGKIGKLTENLPVIPDIPNKLEQLVFFTDNSVDEQHSWLHKLTTANIIKRLSPHIEHYDSRVNGYAIAEFTRSELNWSVYRVNTTEYDKLDDGRNVSTNRAGKELVQSAKYKPEGIDLDD